MDPQGKQISLSVRGGVDLQDAFCHFGVHPDELRHCISPGLESGTGNPLGGDVVWLQGSTTRYGPLERSRRVAGAVVVPPSFRTSPSLHRRRGARNCATCS